MPDPNAHFRTLAAYNAWANTRLYTLLDTLPAEEVKRPRPAFFGSILGTLNHVLVGDTVWVSRFDGGDPGVDRLDAVLHPDLTSLWAARRIFDDRIVALVERLDGDWVEGGTLSYRSLDGTPLKTPVWLVLTHLFNHQTHHRGQVHDMICQTGAAPPPLDLIYFARETMCPAGC